MTENEKKYVFVVTRIDSYADDLNGDCVHVCGVFSDDLTAYDFASKALRDVYKKHRDCGTREVHIVGDFQVVLGDYKTIWFSIERFELDRVENNTLL